MTRSKTFRGTLEPLRGNGLNWTIVLLPFDVRKVWNSGGRLPVRIEVNGFEYRTSLFPRRNGEHFLLINKKMQKEAGITLNSEAKFTVTPDEQPREVQTPRELTDALKEDPALRKWFDSLSYSVRKWLADIITGAQSAESRRNRAVRTAEQLMEAMEAEQELPPMIRQTFNRIPGAEHAWQQLTPRQRRHNLLAIFYYRTPQSRLKRLEKAIEQALESAEKKR